MALTQAEVRAAAETLRRVLAEVAAGQLSAGSALVSRIEGAVATLDVLAPPRGAGSGWPVDEPKREPGA